MTVDEHTIAQVLIDSIQPDGVGSRALTIGDQMGTVGQRLAQAGAAATSWLRRVTGDFAVSVWPADGPFDLITLRLPHSRDELEMMLHLAGARLVPGGRLLVYGANDEGIKSAVGSMAKLFGSVETVLFKRRCRVLESKLTGPPPVFRAAPSQWEYEVGAVLPNGHRATWLSYPGIFAHGRLDEGTELLLRVLPDVLPDHRVLDFGCGCGIIAGQILSRQPAARVDMVDNDALAIAAAERNVPQATSRLGFWWQPVSGQRYDWIVSNPPIHQGKAKDLSLLGRFVTGAGEHLSRPGQVLFVVQRAAPSAKLLESAGLASRIVVQSRRYRVWHAQTQRRRDLRVARN